MTITKVLDTPGVYRVSVHQSIDVSNLVVTIHVWGAGGGGGGCSNSNVNGQGGGYTRRRIWMQANQSLKIAVGGPGTGGQVKTGNAVYPYGSSVGCYGGGSMSAFTGGPSGGVTNIAPNAQVSTGGSGGGASVVLLDNTLLCMAGGGSGAGGGILNYPMGGYLRSKAGFTADSGSNMLHTTPFGIIGITGGGGGGGGGGQLGALIGNGGRTEVQAGQEGRGGVGYGGRSGQTVVWPSSSNISPAFDIIAPVSGRNPSRLDIQQLYSTTPKGLGGLGSSSNGGHGTGGLVILEFETPAENGISINNYGSWVKTKGVHVKVNGTWNEVQNAFYKTNGVWKKFYGFNDSDIIVTSLTGEYIIPAPEPVIPGADEPPAAPVDYADIETFPASISLTAIEGIRKTTDYSFKFRSIGTSALHINNIYVEGLTTSYSQIYRLPSGVHLTSFAPSPTWIDMGIKIQLDSAGTFNGHLVIESNAAGKERVRIPLTVTVASNPQPLTMSGYVALTQQGSGVWTPPSPPAGYAPITKVTVVIQGGGRSGATGGYADYAGVYATGGTGGGAGQRYVVTNLTIGPSVSYYVGGENEISSFGGHTAARGLLTAGDAGIGPPHRGGNGADGPSFSYGEFSTGGGGGAGGQNSLDNQYNVQPGPGQGGGLLNSGANGTHATSFGAGGGGGGLDEGYGPGAGGIGGGGYIFIAWGSDADAIAASTSSTSPTNGSAGYSYFFGGEPPPAPGTPRATVEVNESDLYYQRGSASDINPGGGVFTIRSTGSTSLNITNITWSGDISSSKVSVHTTSGGSGTGSLAAGGSLNFGIMIDASDIGPASYDGYVNVYSNDPASPIITKHFTVTIWEQTGD